MNKLSIALLAALTGCASFQDPSASKAEIRQCQVEARAFARENTSALEFLAFGPLGRKMTQHDAFDRCMAARGYRTAKQ